MTKNEAIKELQSYRKFLAVKKRREERKEELRAQMQNVKITNYGDVNGANPYRIEETIDKLVEIEKQCLSAFCKAQEMASIIESKIEQFDGIYYDVFYRHYINGEATKDIADEICYSDGYIRHIISDGLLKYCKL